MRYVRIIPLIFHYQFNPVSRELNYKKNRYSLTIMKNLGLFTIKDGFTEDCPNLSN
jgi:hypothetical protein